MIEQSSPLVFESESGFISMYVQMSSALYIIIQNFAEHSVGTYLIARSVVQRNEIVSILDIREISLAFSVSILDAVIARVELVRESDLHIFSPTFQSHHKVHSGYIKV